MNPRRAAAVAARKTPASLPTATAAATDRAVPRLAGCAGASCRSSSKITPRRGNRTVMTQINKQRAAPEDRRKVAAIRGLATRRPGEPSAARPRRALFRADRLREITARLALATMVSTVRAIQPTRPWPAERQPISPNSSFASGRASATNDPQGDDLKSARRLTPTEITAPFRRCGNCQCLLQLPAQW